MVETKNIKVIGKVSDSILKRLNLSEKLSGDLILFTGIADYDIPLNYKFTYAQQYDANPKPINATLQGITQQYGKLFDEIPNGWKTIISLKFEGDIPSILNEIPTIDNWYDKRKQEVLLY